MSETNPMNGAGENDVEVLEGGKKSSWMKLVMKVKKSNPKLSLGQAMKKAKTMYKKTRRGGGVITPALYGGGLEGAPVGGRRRGSRKGSRKTRKNRKY